MKIGMKSANSNEGINYFRLKKIFLWEYYIYLSSCRTRNLDIKYALKKWWFFSFFGWFYDDFTMILRCNEMARFQWGNLIFFKNEQDSKTLLYKDAISCTPNHLDQIIITFFNIYYWVCVISYYNLRTDINTKNLFSWFKKGNCLCNTCIIWSTVRIGDFWMLLWCFYDSFVLFVYCLC